MYVSVVIVWHLSLVEQIVWLSYRQFERLTDALENKSANGTLMYEFNLNNYWKLLNKVVVRAQSIDILETLKLASYTELSMFIQIKVKCILT